MQDKETSSGVAITDPTAPLQSRDEALRLGMLLGQRRAFGAMAGRCSAAHAESLRRIKEEKLYSPYAATWAEYCAEVLKISRRSADRMIGYLKEFGPVFFEVAELTGIAPDAYRAFASAMQKDGIHVDGEVIALLPENAERAVEAVEKLRKAVEPPRTEAPKPEPPKPEERKINLRPRGGKEASESIAEAARRANEMGEIFVALVEAGPSEEHRAILKQSMNQLVYSIFDTLRKLEGR